MAAGIYNIPFGLSFVDALAARFLKIYYDCPLDLADILFLTPNRRSVLSLKEAFLRQNGLKPFLLPKIKAIGDVSEDEIIFFRQNKELSLNLPPAVSPYERLFLFAKLICSKHDTYGIKDISFEQALFLAADLSKLMDDIYNENLTFENLASLVPQEYAAHWQEILKFLQIVTAFWPDILKERNVMDASQKKNILLKLQAQQIEQNPPAHKIVAAGLTTAFEGLREILSAIAKCPNGEIYLYGLDRHLPDDVFENLIETHAQFENKNLLTLLGLKRENVVDIQKPLNPSREILISEIMRPAETTAKWREIKSKLDFKTAAGGIHLIECRDNFEEASAIALAMREVLETPEKTAVLITTDRTLARSVSAALKRFDIDIDDSAGLPLHLSPVGIYLRQIISVVETDFSKTAVAALLKNPYLKLQKSAQNLRTEIRKTELKRRLPRFDKEPEEIFEDDALTVLLKTFFEPLQKLYLQETASLKELIEVHLKTAETLASNEEIDGAQSIWRHDDGKLAAACLAKILEKADIAGDIFPKSYGAVFERLLALESVRKTYGTHPRLKILGPIEARFNHFDRIIVGGLNEGVWPMLQNADPFMSRTMKKDYGLPLPERSIGVTAFDLSAFMAAPEVFLTRAERTAGTPTTKSRYWLRFETIAQIFEQNIADLKTSFYNNLALKCETPDTFQKIEPAAPKPPLYARPRRFSASSIEKLMRNPYEIYARYILKLKVLDALDADIKQTVFGTIVHKVLERFCLKYPNSLDDKAYDFLLDLASEEFKRYKLDSKEKIFFRARFEKTAAWIIETEKAYRFDILRAIPEVRGIINLDMPNGPVIIEARADRIDETKRGSYCILDYKTGQARSKAEIKSGYAPQLAIEALIASNGGFSKDGQKLAPKKVEKLLYWQLAKKITSYDENIDTLIDDTTDRLKRLISAFDFESTPYLARPNPKHLDQYADYEHLARVKEWSLGDDDA